MGTKPRFSQQKVRVTVDGHPVELVSDPSGGFTVYAADLPGLVTEGPTLEIAIANSQRAIRLYERVAKEAPPSQSEPPGDWERRVHAALQDRQVVRGMLPENFQTVIVQGRTYGRAGWQEHHRAYADGVPPGQPLIVMPWGHQGLLHATGAVLVAATGLSAKEFSLLTFNVFYTGR